MKRRTFLKTGTLALPGLMALLGLPLFNQQALASKPTGAGFDPESLFVGERLEYHISFWWFDKVGSVSMSFQRLSNGRGFLAQAGGRTHGLIGFVTRYRQDLYRTFMRYDEKAGLLLPYRFEEDVIVGQEKDLAVRVFDHKKRTITLSKLRPSGIIETELHQMPDPYTVDYLTGYYNLRGGAYGKPEPGTYWQIPTMPNQGSDHIKVWFQDQQTAERMRKKDKVPWPHYAKIILDPKMIRSEKGRVDGWMDKDLKPRVGIVRDVLFFGDIKGVIAKEQPIARISETKPSPLKPFSPVNDRESGR